MVDDGDFSGSHFLKHTETEGDGKTHENFGQWGLALIPGIIYWLTGNLSPWWCTVCDATSSSMIWCSKTIYLNFVSGNLTQKWPRHIRRAVCCSSVWAILSPGSAGSKHQPVCRSEQDFFSCGFPLRDKWDRPYEPRWSHCSFSSHNEAMISSLTTNVLSLHVTLLVSL